MVDISNQQLFTFNTWYYRCKEFIASMHHFKHAEFSETFDSVGPSQSMLNVRKYQNAICMFQFRVDQSCAIFYSCLDEDLA